MIGRLLLSALPSDHTDADRQPAGHARAEQWPSYRADALRRWSISRLIGRLVGRAHTILLLIIKLTKWEGGVVRERGVVVWRGVG